MCGICGCKQPKDEISGHRHLDVELDLFSLNDRHAQTNRERFARQSLLVLNLVSSPGAGKTLLLEQTLKAQLGRIAVGVIEGDQQTSHDADRIRATGAPAVQINTGAACHLDAHMVGHALEELDMLRNGILYIENVGNLVCPANFDLGEAAKVVILSVTEGDDKPLKYPDMFVAAQMMVINKLDLLPHVDFDLERCIDYARRVNPEIQVIQLSAQTGEGMQAWLDWLEESYQTLIAHRIDQLEQELAGLKALLERG
ncbi:MAG: hydrogenase nickel incorporation protein HypB [Marinobacterium sp.]